MEIKMKKYRDGDGRKVVEVNDLSYLGNWNHEYSWFQLHKMHHTTGWAVRRADVVFVPNETVAKDVVKYYLIPKDKVVIDPSRF
jgi:hypothetical protein